MKIPSKLKINGITWRVLRNRNSESSGFDYKNAIITIGGSDKWAHIHLFHELLELVLMDNYCRFYGNEANMEYLFVFNHTQMSVVADRLAQIFKENNLLRS